MRRRERGLGEPVAWGSKKLMALLACAAVTVVGLLIGLGLWVYYALESESASQPDQTPRPTESIDPRDRIAEQPMVSVPPDASHPGPLTTKPFETLVLPRARRLGPADVSTGFSLTDEAALAQLIAIDQTALQSASVPGAQAVINAWAMPGGPTGQSWSGAKAIAEMLTSAGLPASGSPSFTVSAAAEMGLVKGAVGDGYVVACVDFVITATMSTTAMVAAADCQRMVWSDHRWMIGPGPEPAQPPSVWPGTEQAHTAGYAELTYE